MVKLNKLLQSAVIKGPGVKCESMVQGHISSCRPFSSRLATQESANHGEFNTKKQPLGLAEELTIVMF